MPQVWYDPPLASTVDCICFAAFHSSDYLGVAALMVLECVEAAEVGQLEDRIPH